DIVVLRPVRDSERFFLTVPLKKGQSVQTHLGAIKHDDIISKSVREVVLSSKGLCKSALSQKQFRIHWPTTDEYITKVRRLVTPIYPQDATTIVSLLDLHVSPPPPPGTDAPRPPRLEILEAGTGHGSLTIALSKAIHAANPPLPPSTSPPSPFPPPPPASPDAVAVADAAHPTNPPSHHSIRNDPRNAIIHTVDVSAPHSEHARKVIAEFRRGMYLHNIDFHVGTPATFLESQSTLRGSKDPFLTAVILDMPNPIQFLQICTDALVPDGILGLFCPSITQITEAIKEIKDQDVLLITDRVIELPNNGGVREWDVRLIKPRGEDVTGDPEIDDNSRLLVCRPKVGKMIVGGGFFATFRKLDLDRKREKRGKGKVAEETAEASTEGWFRNMVRRYLGF
ncbi:S-adenosyl-L-methionine-dependent methyltransferase, partial [Kalaharituber pfeilii]